MSTTLIHVDEQRAQALKDAVSAGGAPSVQAAVEVAVDAWLTERALLDASDETLQRIWREGVDSGDGGEADFSTIKSEARRAP